MSFHGQKIGRNTLHYTYLSKANYNLGNHFRTVGEHKKGGTEAPFLGIYGNRPGLITAVSYIVLGHFT